MVLSVLPLVLICVTLGGVLLAGAVVIANEQAAATATATATVSRDGVGRRGLALDWTDGAGRHHGRLVLPQVGRTASGRQVRVNYGQADPGRCYAAGDGKDVGGRNLLNGLQFALLVLVVGVLTTAFRLWRRVVAERRPVHTYPVRWAQYRRGLIRRSWLVVDDGKQEWWGPVYWGPGLNALLAGTPAQGHRNPALDQPLV